jgi:hypothetical protein
MQTDKPTLAIMAAAVFCLALVTQAQTAASSRYRVEGTVIPAGVGRSSHAALTLYQIVAQPELLGDAAGSVGTVLQGWRLPARVERLYRYALEPGWNLQGAPGLSDQSAGYIFSGAGGAPIKIGNLQYLTPTNSFIEADDDDPVLGLQAFWVFSYWGGSGRLFATPDAHTPDDGTAWQDLLQAGWNLFSPPYTVTVPSSDAVAVPASGSIVAVWRWDPASSSYAVVLPGEELHPLAGYWVFKLNTEY